MREGGMVLVNVRVRDKVNSDLNYRKFVLN